MHAARTLLLVLLTGAGLGLPGPASAAPVKLVEQAPLTIREVAPGVVLVDFGRVAFGNVLLRTPAVAGSVTVHFGEKLDGDRVDRKPSTMSPLLICARCAKPCLPQSETAHAPGRARC